MQYDVIFTLANIVLFCENKGGKKGSLCRGEQTLPAVLWCKLMSTIIAWWPGTSAFSRHYRLSSGADTRPITKIFMAYSKKGACYQIDRGQTSSPCCVNGALGCLLQLKRLSAAVSLGGGRSQLLEEGSLPHEVLESPHSCVIDVTAGNSQPLLPSSTTEWATSVKKIVQRFALLANTEDCVGAIYSSAWTPKESLTAVLFFFFFLDSTQKRPSSHHRVWNWFGCDICLMRSVLQSVQCNSRRRWLTSHNTADCFLQFSVFLIVLFCIDTSSSFRPDPHRESQNTKRFAVAECGGRRDRAAGSVAEHHSLRCQHRTIPRVVVCLLHVRVGSDRWLPNARLMSLNVLFSSGHNKAELAKQWR